MFRLPALSTDSSDHSSLGHDLMLPPLAGVIDIERYLDMDGVGKRPGEIRVQVCDHALCCLFHCEHVFAESHCVISLLCLRDGRTFVAYCL